MTGSRAADHEAVGAEEARRPGSAASVGISQVSGAIVWAVVGNVAGHHGRPPFRVVSVRIHWNMTVLKQMMF